MGDQHDDERNGKRGGSAESRPRGRGADGETREERLARALRDNLRKRKAQQRARRGGGRGEGERG